MEALPEYQDARLSLDERRKVERHLEVCSICREELSSLRQTVGLLKRVPMESPRRVFTLGEAPYTAPAPQRIKLPTWAYGAATSVAVMLFALVLSADLGGLLAQDAAVPDQAARAEETSLVPTTTPQSTTVTDLATQEPQQEERGPTPSDGRLERAIVAPTSTPAATPIPTPQAEATSKEAKETAELDTATLPTVSPSPTTTPHSVPIPAPIVATASTPSPAATPASTPVQIAAPAPTGTPSPAGTPTPPAPTPSPTPTSPPITPSPTPSPAATPAPPAAASDLLEVPSAEATDGATALVWRVLEGVFGGVALLLLAGILWRMRRRPRPITS